MCNRCLSGPQPGKQEGQTHVNPSMRNEYFSGSALNWTPVTDIQLYLPSFPWDKWINLWDVSQNTISCMFSQSFWLPSGHWGGVTHCLSQSLPFQQALHVGFHQAPHPCPRAQRDLLWKFCENFRSSQSFSPPGLYLSYPFLLQIAKLCFWFFSQISLYFTDRVNPIWPVFKPLRELLTLRDMCCLRKEV